MCRAISAPQVFKPPWTLQIVFFFFLAAVALQLLFLISFLLAVARKRHTIASTFPPVSVIVCAHDEEQNLRSLIPLLLEQEYPQFEVIIVDDRSNDGTYDYLLQATREHPALRMVKVDRVPPHANGKKYGLTLGIRAASHEWILLTDADCRPASKAWIAGMSRHFYDGVQIVAGISTYRKERGLLNLFVRFEGALTALQYVAFGLLNMPYMGVGRNLAYRKSLFLENKGFNQFLGIIGGDDDLFVNQHATSKNWRVELGAETNMLSIPEKTWKEFFLQKVRHLSVGKHYRFVHRFILGAFMLSGILTWLTGLPVIIAEPSSWWGATLFVVRFIVLAIAIRVILKKAGISFEWWAIPFLDFLYSIYYISTGLKALTSKNIQWTK